MRGTRRVGVGVVLTLLISAAVLAGRPDLAGAVGETCHGLPATVVGTPGAELHGTAGADVVVTNGAFPVFADAGNDLVCVTGGAGLSDQDHMDVYGEDGDDVIDATTLEADRLFVELGPGNDTFAGGPEEDGVVANAAFDDSSPAARTAGNDTVSTGAGDDNISTGGPQGYPDRDTVDLGPGRDTAGITGSIDPALPIQGGEGSDDLEFDRDSLDHALVIDNAAQHATDAGAPVMTWSSFERFSLTPIGPYEPPSFIGGPGPERLQGYIPLTALDLGGGDDVVNLEHQKKLVDHASYAGGTGDDAFILYAGPGDSARRVRLDVPKGKLLFQREQEAVRARIGGFERYRFSARQFDFRGTAAAERLAWQSCQGLVDGGRGDDLIETFSNPDVGCGYPVSTADLVVRGGGGDDTLVGNGDPNVLLGGPGKDRADGRGSKSDRCAAEIVKHCEL
jgi:hypothetical protein